MKHIFVVLMMLCAYVAHAQTPSNCADFKTGKFILTDQVEGDLQIERDNKFQYEMHETLKKPIRFYINWIDECTYTLIPEKPKQAGTPKGVKNPVMTFRITETRANSYTVSVSSNFHSAIYEFNIKRAKTN
jgi:hypothetical protein